jgi:hypothetical protein
LKQKSYIQNTVLIANQLLDSIEKDVKVSRSAVESKDRYIDMIEKENSSLRAQLIESKVRHRSLSLVPMVLGTNQRASSSSQ